jgi:type VI secretion system protein ImpH
MANATGPTPADTLIQRLIERGDRFDLYHAIRLLNCSLTGAEPVGQARLPSRESYRFIQHVSLSFARSTIEKISRRPDGKLQISTNGFGLLGPNGPMPLQLTEHVLERSRHFRDRTHEEFLNLLHHRLMTLFYRAWAINQQCISLDAAARSTDVELVKRDRFGLFVGSLIGLGLPELNNRDHTDDHGKLFYSGLLTDANRSPLAFEKLLAHYFAVPAKIEEFVMRWITVEGHFTTRLGTSRSTGLLGRNVMLGHRFKECQSTFKIRLGPMKLSVYQHLLPGNEGFFRLRDWIRLYAGLHLDWQVQYVLSARETPPTVLGKSGSLGQTTWLWTKPMEVDPDHYTYTHAGV